MKIGITTKQRNTILKSIIWNTVREVFMSQKNIDITKDLVSIVFKRNTIIVKTQKPILNAELLMVNSSIQEALKVKFEVLGVDYGDYNIQYM